MPTDASSPTAAPSPLDRARGKAYRRLLPILFACYVIAYVDRTNVGLAKLHMMGDLNAQARGDEGTKPLFNEEAFGFGAGTCFFVGYLLLEIPGTLLVEKWSARKWICRIMVTWGVVAALTALVKVPWHFYGIRFLLGVAEAGFFPGVIVYLTHWFPGRDRARALSWFLIATPIAQFISPKLTYYLLRIGTDETIGRASVVHHPLVLGLKGWQWVYIGWGLPAVVLGAVVMFFLTDRPRQARWLDDDEREALETVLEREKAPRKAAGGHMTLREAFSHPKVLLLTAAYFFIVTGNYGVEMFLPTILRDWYHPTDRLLTWVLMIPPLGSLVGPALRGLELRPDEGAAAARGAADPDRRHRPGPEPDPRHAAGRDDPDLHRRGPGDEGVSARLLDPAQPLPDRGGRGREHRADQLVRQPRRRRRAAAARGSSRTGPVRSCRASSSSASRWRPRR